MRILVTVLLICFTATEIFAQNSALNSFTNAGGSIFFLQEGAPHPAHTGVIGQPMITQFYGGTLVVANFMYATDLHPPVITHNTQAVSITLNEENTISFIATDNNQVISSKLYYKPIGSIENFESVDASPTTGSNYSTAILPNWYDMMGMEYYLEVRDSENTTRHPAGNAKHIVWTTHPAPQIPTTLLSYGRTKNNYRIISIPYETTNPITQIFEELGPSDKKKYRIYKYESGAFKEYPSFTTVKRGEGYFIIMSDILSNVVLSMPEFNAPSNSQASLYELPLQPGWNLIGNPYTLDINWDDILKFNGEPERLASDLKVWTENGQYGNVKNLAAYQGAFVWLEGTLPLLLKVSFKGQLPQEIDERLRTNGTETDFWKINLTLQGGAEENTLAAFGMHKEAALGFDRFDDLNPPTLDNFLTLRFLHPEHTQRYFVRDIVPHALNYTWEMEVPSGGNDERKLNWSSADLTTIPSDIMLYDQERNKVIDMKANSHYSFPPSSQNFKIYFGPANQYEINPERIIVLPPYPNPVIKEQEAVFSIGLPESDIDYPVKLNLFDAIGNSVYQQEQILPSGIHEIRLPGQSEMKFNIGELLFYQLSIGSARFSGKIMYNP